MYAVPSLASLKTLLGNRFVIASTLLSGVALLAGCSEVSRNEFVKLENDIQQIRRLQADQRSELEQVREEVRATSGRLDEIEHSQNQRMGRDLSSLREDLTSLKQRVPPPSVVPAELLAIDEKIATSFDSESGEHLRNALTALREADYRRAQEEISIGLATSRDPETVGHLMFWQGVAFDGVNDNRESLRAYNELITNYPRHPRTPAALLRQASVFVRLGDEKAATLTLKKLVKDFPNTAETRAAKERLLAFGVR